MSVSPDTILEWIFHGDGDDEIKQYGWPGAPVRHHVFDTVYKLQGYGRRRGTLAVKDPQTGAISDMTAGHFEVVQAPAPTPPAASAGKPADAVAVSSASSASSASPTTPGGAAAATSTPPSSTAGSSPMLPSPSASPSAFSSAAAAAAAAPSASPSVFASAAAAAAAAPSASPSVFSAAAAAAAARTPLTSDEFVQDQFDAAHENMINYRGLLETEKKRQRNLALQISAMSDETMFIEDRIVRHKLASDAQVELLELQFKSAQQTRSHASLALALRKKRKAAFRQQHEKKRRRARATMRRSLQKDLNAFKSRMQFARSQWQIGYEDMYDMIKFTLLE